MPRQRYLGDRSRSTGRTRYKGDVAAPPVEKKHGHGLLGTIAHIPGSVGRDVASELVGFVPGVYHAGKALGTDVVKDVTFQDVGHHRSKFVDEVVVPTLHGINEDRKHPLRHPLYTLQDALSIASLGTAGASRAGLLSRDRALLETRSPRKVSQGEGPVAKRLTENMPLSRGRQRLAHGIAQQAPYTAPVVGEGARYGKELRRQAKVEGLKELPAYRVYAKAWQKLNQRERQALNLIPRGVHPADLAEAWQGTKAGEIAANPKVQELVLKPTPKLQQAVAAARNLSLRGEGLFKQLGYLGEESAAARPAKFHTAISDKLGREAKLLPGESFYLPDQPMAIRQKDPFGGMGAGKGLPRKPGTAKLNQGIRARLGTLDITNDVLGPEFLRRAHLKVHDAVSGGLRAAAIRLTPDELNTLLHEHGDALPKGWEFLTAPVVGKTGNIRPQKINPARRVEGDISATPESLAAKGLTKPPVPVDARGIVPNPGELHDSVLSEPFSTRRKEQAHFDGEFYYVAPKNLVRAAAGEFHRSQWAVRMLIERPLQVWRAIILGLRVGFFTNNVIGNHLIYAVRTAGIGGLRAYLHAVQETHGAAKVRELLGKDYVPKGVTQQLMDEFFPEQVEGTFGRTQSPATDTLRSKAGKTTAKLKLGIIPATQSVAETVPRRALVEVMLRKSPEFRKVYKGLPKQAGRFDKAARKALSGRGSVEYQRLISNQVNNALGDYLGLGSVERNAVRNLVPFYSWYKAIATIAYKLQVDSPVRISILGRLGEIGDEDTTRALGALPTWLRGVIPIGQRHGDIQRVLATGGMNPYATIPQVGSGVTEDINGLGLAPYLSVPWAVAARSYGQPLSLVDVLKQSGITFGKSLPPARLISPPPPSGLYPERDRTSELLAYLGVPLKDLNVPEANRRAKR